MSFENQSQEEPHKDTGSNVKAVPSAVDWRRDGYGVDSVASSREGGQKAMPEENVGAG